MNKTKIILWLLVLVCGLVLAVNALAANGFLIQRSVIAGGGQPAEGGSFRLNGTIAEPVAGNLSIDGSYGLHSGFWWKSGHTIFLPLVVR